MSASLRKETFGAGPAAGPACLTTKYVRGGIVGVERPGYYAIIPADVRYDDRLPANAKLLYGEISALIGSEGFCYATNSYFMKIYGFSDPTISRLISALEKNGYIKRELERDTSGQVVRRKLYLSVSAPQIQPPINFDTTSPQNCGEGGIKNDGYTNLSITDNTPQSPPEGGGQPKKPKHRRSGYISKAQTLPERFEGFWLFYRKHIPEGSNAGNRQKALRAWDKLAPDNELASEMAVALARQVKSQTWRSGVGVPHASTWLNNHGWEDDWGPAPGAKQNSSEIPNSEEAAEWVTC